MSTHRFLSIGFSCCYQRIVVFFNMKPKIDLVREILVTLSALEDMFFLVVGVKLLIGSKLEDPLVGGKNAFHGKIAVEGLTFKCMWT